MKLSVKALQRAIARKTATAANNIDGEIDRSLGNGDIFILWNNTCGSVQHHTNARRRQDDNIKYHGIPRLKGKTILGHTLLASGRVLGLLTGSF